jgi:uncharacterized protein (UPF0332 family)
LTPINREKAADRHLLKAKSALSDAKVMIGQGLFEPAASRAYYCCFHAARAALASLGVQPRTHRGVSERLNLDLVATGKLEAEYLSLLGKIQRDREVSDYDVEITISEADARRDVDDAARFLARLERLLQKP